MKRFLILFFIFSITTTFSQVENSIQFESDTLVRWFNYPFKLVAPAEYDTLFIQLDGCTGKLISDSIGLVKSDSLSTTCNLTILKVINDDTTIYSSKSLVIEDLKTPKFQVGGFDILNLNQKRVEFDNFILKLVNVTGPDQLVYLNFLLTKIILMYNGVEITLQYAYPKEEFKKKFEDSKKGDVIIIKSFSYIDPTKRGRHEVVINKKFTRVGFKKYKFKIEEFQ